MCAGARVLCVRQLAFFPGYRAHIALRCKGPGGLIWGSKTGSKTADLLRIAADDTCIVNAAAAVDRLPSQQGFSKAELISRLRCLHGGGPVKIAFLLSRQFNSEGICRDD